MPKTTYFENAVLNSALNAMTFTAPTTVYVALYTSSPTTGGGGTEVTGGSYARQVATFTSPSGGSCSNSADITYPVATAGWGTVVAFSIMDALTGGNMIYFGSLTTPRLVNVSDQIKFPASGGGNLVVQEI